MAASRAAGPTTPSLSSQKLPQFAEVLAGEPEAPARETRHSPAPFLETARAWAFLARILSRSDALQYWPVCADSSICYPRSTAIYADCWWAHMAAHFIVGRLSSDARHDRHGRLAGVVLAVVAALGALLLGGTTLRVDPLLTGIAGYDVGEGGPAVVVVTRGGFRWRTSSVVCSTEPGEATPGADYAAVEQTVVFAPGERSAACIVPLRNDTELESVESFTVVLRDPEGAVLGNHPSVRVRIQDDDQTSTKGSWTAVTEWPVVPIHAHVLPTGSVMFWDRHGHGEGWNGLPHIWDPERDAFRVLANPGYDVFCSGHSLTAEGHLLITGGHIDNGVGDKKSVLFNPFTEEWTKQPDMNDGRWYPTNVGLANGDVLVLAGTSTGDAVVNPLPQVWETATHTWRDLSSAVHGSRPEWAHYYPFSFLAPNGHVFVAGPQQMARYLDTSGTGRWSDVAPSALTCREYGSSVMYDDGKVLIVGGNACLPDSWPEKNFPTASAEVIDLAATQPVWRSVAPLSVGRRQHTATILPDGQVLVTGGTAMRGKDTAAGGVFYPELWDPVTEQWTLLAGHVRYRGYHSVAMLLPDGRVLVGGGGHPDPEDGKAEPNVEIFSPPYLQRGSRPAIADAPARVAYGETFDVATPDADRIGTVTWLRLSSVTHAFNQNQRINRLAFTRTADGLRVTAPTDPNLAPPGHYMLFILDREGTPSVAAIVQIL